MMQLIAGMINRTAALFATLAWTALAAHQDACAQTLTCAEIQGQADVSPYEGQEVTVSAKVTDYFGDVLPPTLYSSIIGTLPLPARVVQSRR